jgi:hypothetical protein
MERGMAEEVEVNLQPPGELLSLLTAERKRQTRIRAVLGAGISALFLLFALTVAHQVRSFDPRNLEIKMNAEASAALWPMVSKELDALSLTAIPTLDQAMALESKTLLPTFNTALEGEKALFVKQLNKRGDRSLEAAIARANKGRGVNLGALRERLHPDPLEADLVYNALLERAQGWARAEIDHLLKEQMGLLEALHGDTTALATEPLDEEALQDAIILFIEIVNSQQGQEE